MNTRWKVNIFHIVKKMLITNDDTKLNVMKLKTDNNFLERNTIVYDFECATKENLGHKPYFNHMIKLYKGEIEEEKTLCHYVNRNDVYWTFNDVAETGNSRHRSILISVGQIQAGIKATSIARRFIYSCNMVLIFICKGE